MTTIDVETQILSAPGLTLSALPINLLLSGSPFDVSVVQKSDPYKVSGTQATPTSTASFKIGFEEFENLCQLLVHGPTKIRLTLEGTRICGFAAYATRSIATSGSVSADVRALRLIAPEILETLRSIEKLLEVHRTPDILRDSDIGELRSASG